MYDDFSGFWKSREKAVSTAIIIAFLLLAVGWICYSLGIRNTGKDIPDNGDSAAGVGNAIESAGSDISAAVSGIDNAAATADRVEARISDAQERAEYLKGTADEGRRLIAECQSILREVRAGGKENAPKN
jgi:hypothetical protein